MADNRTFARRFITSVILITLVGLVIFAFPAWVFTTMVAVLSGLALSEFYALAERKGMYVWPVFGVIIGMLVPVIMHLQLGNEGYFTLEPFFIVIACLFTFVLQLTRRDNSQALASIAATLFGLLYIGWFLSFAIKIRFLPDGARLIAFLILVTKIGDVGAYLVGSAFGKHSLIPRISPKKTVEGTIGGLICSVAAALASKAYLPFLSYQHLFMLGILLGILAQVGDLAESILKRDCGVKDSGAKLSGFGGFLDLLDSLLFTTPIFYFYIKVLLR